MLFREIDNRINKNGPQGKSNNVQHLLELSEELGILKNASYE